MHFKMFGFIFVKSKVNAGAMKLMSYNLLSFIYLYPFVRQLFAECWLSAKYCVKL